MRVLLAFILVIFMGASVDTQAENYDNYIVVTTSIVDDSWSATILETTLVMEARARSFGIDFKNDGASWFLVAYCQWGNISYSINSVMTIDILVESVIEQGDDL